MTTAEFVKGLRTLADWYEAHPFVPILTMPLQICNDVDDKETLAAIARAAGQTEKVYDGLIFRLCFTVGGIPINAIAWRDAVCTRRVVGKRAIPEVIIPARVEDIVEWDCSDGILNAPTNEDASKA